MHDICRQLKCLVTVIGLLIILDSAKATASCTSVSGPPPTSFFTNISFSVSAHAQSHTPPDQASRMLKKKVRNLYPDLVAVIHKPAWIFQAQMVIYNIILSFL